MLKHLWFYLAVQFCILLFPAAQVYGQFSTTLNIPPDSAPAFIESGTQLNLFDGGLLDASFYALGGQVNISGGSVGDDFEALGNSEVNITGGLVGDGFDAHAGSSVSMSGGLVGEQFKAFSGSKINLLGTEFTLDGLDLTALLTLDIPLELTGRNVNLRGLLADGSPFSFDLNSAFQPEEDYFDAGALLSVTLVGPKIDADFDNDGDVDGSDFLAWQVGFGSIYDATDFAAWKSQYGNISNNSNNLSGATVPEPSTLLLAVMACFGFLLRRKP